MTCIEAQYVPYQAVLTLGPGKALVFAPHPDDEVFGCAGAIIRHIDAGDPVQVVIVTDGAFGAGAGDREYARTRQAESRMAARLLGYGEPEFWAYPDRGLIQDDALVERIREIIASTAPALVYAPSWWEVHPDHTALSLAVTRAVKRSIAPSKLVLYEVGVPLHANCLLDITACMALKQAAMACFASQLVHQSYDRHITALNHYRTYTLPPSVQAAEGYRLLERDALPEIPRAPLIHIL